MDTHDKRQLYRVIIKALAFSALFILIGVFILSVFINETPVANSPHSTNLNAIARFDLKPRAGKVQLIRWGQQEISILYRTPEMLASIPIPATTSTEPYLNPQWRSQVADYFVYLNKGDGVGCPISLAGSHNQPMLRDACTAQTYDLAGRPLHTHLKTPALSVPPHHFKAPGQITLGSWGIN